MSRDARSVYHYSTLMLGDLGPRQPTVRGWPCYLWPPPQLIVGYPYFVRVCHDYAFDRRTFSLLGFRERRARQSRTLDWQCLASCSYDINVGAYLRFLDIDDFEETLTQIQQSLLSDRIVADLQLADPLAGVGLWRLPGDDLRGAGQPESSAAASTPSLQALLHRRFRHLQDCGPAVWGLCERSAALPADPEAEPSPAPPQDVLGVIRRLRSAYFRFLLLHQQRRRRRPEPPTAPPTVRDEFLRYLPHRGDPPLDPNQHSPWTSQDWLSRFVEAFAIPLRGDERLVGEVPSQPDERTAEMLFMADDGPASRKEQTLVTLRTVIDALSLPHRLPPNRRRELVGGAVQLRPRVNGRAVTATMRLQRGQVVQRFIDSLPLPTRRRRRPPPAAQVISESETEEEEEEDSDDDDEEDDIYADMPPLEGDEDEDAWWVADPRERDRRRRRRDRQENAWLREVRAAVAEAVRLLQDELAVERGNWEPTFFEFPRNFYEAMRRLQEADDVNETTLRRWVVYFFVCEHLAATLNYLHVRLVRQPHAARHLRVVGAQVVIRAFSADGRPAFTRVWHESEREHSFVALMQRLARDLSALVSRAGVDALDDEALIDVLEDIAWQENSGEVQDLIDQVTLNDADIDRLDLSFRIRLQGPVAISGHPSIQEIQRRVIREARQRTRTRQPLPRLHEPLVLPPDPRPPGPPPARLAAAARGRRRRR